MTARKDNRTISRVLNFTCNSIQTALSKRQLNRRASNKRARSLAVGVYRNRVGHRSRIGQQIKNQITGQEPDHRSGTGPQIKHWTTDQEPDHRSRTRQQIKNRTDQKT
ncbi:UNVERIFIED_CONTAM: hypothetical protein FKN15_065218 [Acipenser sinensis]